MADTTQDQQFDVKDVEQNKVWLLSATYFLSYFLSHW